MGVPYLGIGSEGSALQPMSEMQLVSTLNPDGSETGSYPVADPYQQWGGQTAYNNLVNQFNTSKGGIYTSANQAGGNLGYELGTGIDSLVRGGRSNQRNIDSQASRNILAKDQASKGIVNMVGRGIKSAGVMLAGKNAGSSSAAQALANAYGDQGRRQMGTVGNQFALGEEDVRLKQVDQDEQMAYGSQNIRESKANSVNKIVNEAREKFASLDAWAQDKSLPQRIAAEQEKEAVRSQLLAQLQSYDQRLATEVGGIKASSIDQRREEAARLGREGTDLGEGAFNYTTEVPGQFQGTGDYASSLPLFTLNKRRQA